MSRESGLSRPERWIVEHRTASSVMTLAFVAACVWIRPICVAINNAAERHERAERATLKERHRQLDEWVEAHHGELRSVCHSSRCECDQIYQDPGEWPVVGVPEKLILKDGQALCVVP